MFFCLTVRPLPGCKVLAPTRMLARQQSADAGDSITGWTNQSATEDGATAQPAGVGAPRSGALI